jgi:YegS/Rv2252/BmrU family lipid kinase
MSAASRFVFVVNPRSAAGATLRRFEAHRRHFSERLKEKGLELEVRLTERPRHATEITRAAIASGATAVVAVGGDGTNNEVVNGFFDDDGARLSGDTAFGVVTSGTGGDFRRAFGWSTNPDDDLERLVHLRRRCIDLGRLTCRGPDGRSVTRHFINVSSFGLSGDVVDVANHSGKRLGAKLSFLAASVQAFLRYTPQTVRLRFDDGPVTTEAITFVALANGQYFGGGMHVAPQASPDDGFFDGVVIKGGGLSFWARHGLKLYSGGLVDVDGVRVVRCKTLHAESVDQGPVYIDLDGEQPGTLPATWTLVPSSLDLLV